MIKAQVDTEETCSKPSGWKRSRERCLLMYVAAQSATSTFLKAADAGSVRSLMRPASSWERGTHKLAWTRMPR